MFVHATHESDLCAYSRIVQLVTEPHLPDPLSQHPSQIQLPIRCCHGWNLSWRNTLPSGLQLFSIQESGIFLPRLEPHTSQSLCRLPNYQFHTQKICPKFSRMSRQSSVNTSGTQGGQAGTSLRKRAQCILFCVKEAASSCWLLALWERRGRQWVARLSVFK